MEIWISLIVISACLVAGEETCVSPAVCSRDGLSEQEWINVRRYEDIQAQIDQVEKSCDEKIENFRSELMSKTPCKKHESCKDVCDDINSGTIPDNPVGLAKHGAEARIFPKFLSENGASVYCDCTYGADKAWTVLQRRMDGSVDFYRKWNDYVNGFGNIKGEFWLGLDLINKFTENGKYKLRFDLADWEGNTAFAIYSPFVVSGLSKNYAATFGRYNGTAGDSVKSCKNSWGNINQKPFSTTNHDKSANCPDRWPGAWWYDNCFCTHLNGIYSSKSSIPFARGVIWFNWKGFHYSLKSAEMKIQKID